jgi:hypothetical protein
MSFFRSTSALALLLFACSSEERTAFPTASTDPTEAGAPAADQDEVGSNDADAAKATDASATDAGTGDDLDLPTNDAGCLAFAAAQQVCGFESDETVCELAVSCGASKDVGTCKINCEMQTTINCYSNADAKCLLDAAKSKSCAKLATCNWKL